MNQEHGFTVSSMQPRNDELTTTPKREMMAYFKNMKMKASHLLTIIDQFILIKPYIKVKYT